MGMSHIPKVDGVSLDVYSTKTHRYWDINIFTSIVRVTISLYFAQMVHRHPECEDSLAIGDTGMADLSQSWDTSEHCPGPAKVYPRMVQIFERSVWRIVTQSITFISTGV